MTYRFNGELLKTRRTKMRMSQRQMAVLLGVTQPYLSGLESGKRLDIFSSRLADIADFIGVEVKDLLVRVEDGIESERRARVEGNPKQD